MARPVAFSCSPPLLLAPLLSSRSIAAKAPARLLLRRRFPRRLSRKFCPPDALRRFGLHTGTQRAAGCSVCDGRAAISYPGDDTGRQAHVRIECMLRAYWSLRIPGGARMRMSRMDTKMVAFRNTMCYGAHCVCMLQVPAVSRHGGAATWAEYSLADGRKRPWRRDVGSSPDAPGFSPRTEPLEPGIGARCGPFRCPISSCGSEKDDAKRFETARKG